MSVVEKASYISRSVLVSEYDGQTYRPKYYEDLVHSEITLPPNEPKSMQTEPLYGTLLNCQRKGRDYTLSYKNNRKTGTGIISIKGKGNYKGRVELPFQITTKDLTDTDITIRVPNVPYTEKPNKYQSNPVLTDIDGGVLTKNKDYTIEAYYDKTTVLDKTSSPKEGMVITVIIKGIGSYTGTVRADYTVKGKSFSQAAIKVASKSYTGSPVTIEASDILSATIKTGKTKTALKLGTDYEIVAYSDNLKKGTATVVFRGIGAYSGEKTVKFKVNSARIE